MDAIAEQLVSRLQRDPNDAQAYEELKAHYRDADDLASLTNLVAGWAAYQTDAYKSSRGYYEAAQVVAKAAPNHARRIELLRQAAGRDVSFREAVSELIELLAQQGDDHALAEFLDAHLRAMEDQRADVHLMAWLYARLAELWGARFERADVARRCYERALELDAGSAPIMRGARALAQATGDARLLARVLAGEARSESLPERKRELLRAQARALQSEPADLDGAVSALREAYKLAPDDANVARELADALGQRAAVEESQTVEAITPQAAADLQEAASLYLKLAQTAPPAEMLELLEAALRAVPEHEDALDMLEREAQTLGQEAILPHFWHAYVAVAPEGPLLDERRVALARAYEAAGQLDDAIILLEQVRTEGPAASLLTDFKVRRGPRSGPPRGKTVDAPPAGTPRPGGGAGATPARAGTGSHAADSSQAAPRQPRTKSADLPLESEQVLLELRRALRNAIATRQGDDIVKHSEAIHALDPHDGEAFTLLESHYRKKSGHARLRALLQEASSAEGLPALERKQLLREVAALSENKLKDTEGAIEALREVVALDGSDLDAAARLDRLLLRTQRWDELAQLLERKARATQDPEQKASLLAQLAELHRDKRRDLPEAVEALRQQHALRPTPQTRDDLCELLLATQAYADAVPLLWQRAHDAEGERERLAVLRQLAELFETQLADREAAFDVCTKILALRPKDLDTLSRMQRIDEETGNAQRLLATLERRAGLLLRGERAALLVEMARIAERDQDDIDRAGEYYRRALELEPSHSGVLDALCGLFESRERYAELATLLGRAADAERDPGRRVELRLRQARLLAGPLADATRAAAAFREVLEHTENAEALSYLLSLAREEQDAETTAALCARLAATLGDPGECRALLFERAQVLVTELGRPRDAIATLRNIVEDVDPDYGPAVEWLAELSGNLGDNAGLASALARRLDKSTTLDARIALAKRLADLQEHELADRDQAIHALGAWIKADPTDVVPQRRLRRLLEESGRYAELVASCEALAQLEPEQSARDEATLEAAQISATQLRAADAGWRMLVPLLSRGQLKAIALLTSLARHGNRFEELAALCVRAAQEATAPDLSGMLWAQATRIFRDELGDPQKAFEAALRLLASDLKNRDALTQVEESAAQAGQWARLQPVYDRLIKAAGSDAERVELLVRHADLLERRAGNASEALDRILQASALAPADEALLAQAETLAARSERGVELLTLCENQAAVAKDPGAQVEWLLRGARFASTATDDRASAHAYVEAALEAARGDIALWELCVAFAQQLDAEPEGDEPNASLRALVAAHRRVAERTDPAIGASLMLRASRLLEDRLDDQRGAFDALRAGSALFPLDENLYDNLLERAEASGRLDALDAHLARGVDDALDPRTAACLLARRARLLEGQLGRPDDAANVYAKLLQLRPDDLQAASKLRDSLRRARRFQDLLVVVHKQTLRAKRPEEKLELLKESAHVWELDLKNRWEAVDAWRKVLELAPGDNEALRALARLDRRSLPPAAAASSRPPRASDSAAPPVNPAKSIKSTSAPPSAASSANVLQPTAANSTASFTESAAVSGAHPSIAAGALAPEVPTAPGLSLPQAPPLANGEPLVEDLPSVDVVPLEDSASVEIAQLQPAPASKDMTRPGTRAGSVPPPLPPGALKAERGSTPPGSPRKD